MASGGAVFECYTVCSPHNRDDQTFINAYRCLVPMCPDRVQPESDDSLGAVGRMARWNLGTKKPANRCSQVPILSLFALGEAIEGQALGADYSAAGAGAAAAGAAAAALSTVAALSVVRLSPATLSVVMLSVAVLSAAAPLFSEPPQDAKDTAAIATNMKTNFFILLSSFLVKQSIAFLKRCKGTDFGISPQAFPGIFFASA